MFNSFDAIQHTIIIGSLGYIFIVFLLRISGKRTLSKWNSFDFIVTIAFGSVLATLLLSKDTSFLQGALGFGLLVLYQFILTWISVRYPIIQKLIKAEPSLLLYQGKLQHHIIKRERVTEGEVLSALRSQGIAAIEDAAAVVLETDGSFSVIKDLGSRYASALKDIKEYNRAVSKIC